MTEERIENLEQELELAIVAIEKLAEQVGTITEIVQKLLKA